MPYTRKGLCCYNETTGKKEGCSKTVAGAKKYLKALYANTKDTSTKAPAKGKTK